MTPISAPQQFRGIMGWLLAKKSLTSVATLVMVLLCSCISGFSQQTPGSTHPKVGLVLEGGSALGLAHVGVLRWLEEHHVPISYIAGTSMGGLVGGIYSTGASADELHDLMKTIKWDEVLKGQTPYKDLSFRRKEDAFDYPNRLEFGLKKGLQFPEGFNSGQQVLSILDRVALPYSDVQDFNDLPTPFACVATDLVNSEKFVFRRGSLSLALRSTMSLPGIFTPVRWGNRIFADGGVLDNLPVDVAKDMGADLTIAVHLEVAKLEPTASLSSFKVVSNSTSVVIAANELSSMQKADVLISVPLQKYNSFSFNKFEELIKAGYEAAEEKASILSKLSIDEPTWEAYVAQREARRRVAPAPQFVKVEGTTPQLAAALEDDLQKNLGKPIDPILLEDQLTDVMGEGRFASLSYQLTNTRDKPGLLVTAAEKPYSPPFIRPLIQLDGSNFAGVNFSIGTRVTFQDFGSYRAELRTDILVGTEYRLASQYYRPLSKTSKWFLAPHLFADYLQFPVYNKDDFLAEYRKTSVGGGIDVGYELGRVAQVTLGYTSAHQQFVPKIGNTAQIPEVSGRFGATTARFSLNGVNDPVIPRTGQYAILSGSWIDANPGAAHGYPLSEGRVAKFVRLNDPSSVYFGAQGGTTFGNELVGVPNFSLGGARGFAAYGQNEFLTNQYYRFHAGYLRRVVKIPVLLGDAVYFTGVAEAGKVFASPFGSQVPADGALALIVNTIFGPIEAGYAFGATGHRSVFFRLGRIF